MARKFNRSYKKGEPHRDYRNFIIISEGSKREPDYFNQFKTKENHRLKIHPIGNDGPSSPNRIIEVYDNLPNIEKVNFDKEDIIWFVTDVDKWTNKQIKELHKFCKSKKLNFAISNPCFEVWLFAHFESPVKIEASNCKELKKEVDTKFGGFHSKKHALSHVGNAIKNTKACFSCTGFIPNKNCSNVYALMEHLFKILNLSYL